MTDVEREVGCNDMRRFSSEAPTYSETPFSRIAFRR